MSAETTLTKIMKEVPKAVAAGVVDMSTGMLIGVKTIDEHPSEVLDLVAAATKDMFEGDNITAIENTFKKLRGVSTDERFMKEVMFTSTNLVHFMGRLKSMQSVVLVAVCRGDANVGLALMKMRAICGSESI